MGRVAVLALILFFLAANIVSKKNSPLSKFFTVAGCNVGQAHITYNDFYGSVMTSNQGWRVSVVSRDGCSASDVNVVLQDGTVIKPDIKNDYYELEKNYRATAFFFNIPNNLAKGSWKVSSPGSQLGPFDFPSIQPQRAFKPSKWAFIADMDDSSYSQSTFDRLEMMSKLDYQGVIHNGDFAYNVHSSKGKKGDQYFEKFSKISARLPYLISPGNHEKYDDFKMFNYRFKMPGGGNPVTQPRASNYYSAIINGVYFFSLNWDWIFMSDNANSRLTEVITWLKADLERHSVNPEVRYRVFFSHKPIYCTFAEEDCLGFYLYKPIESLFYKYKFDLLLGSHVHLYYRHKKFDSKFNIVNQNSPFPITIITGHQGVDPSEGGNTNIVPSDRLGRLEVIALAGAINILTVEFKSDGIALTLNDCLTNRVVDQIIVPKRTTQVFDS